MLDFVQCRICKGVFAHNSKSTGTGTLLTHMNKCLARKESDGASITKFVKKDTVRAADKSRVVDALAWWCSINMRPFEISSDEGLIELQRGTEK